jgi:hypothetical protein
MQNLKELLIKSLNIVNNKEILIICSAFKISKNIYKFYTNNIFCPIALYLIGILYQYASLESRNDYESTMVVVKNRGVALEYASLELRNNYKIVIETVKNNGFALNYFSNILQNNYCIILTAIKTYEEHKKLGFTYQIEIPYKYTDKYKTIEKIKEILEIYCQINKFEYNNFAGDFDLLIKNEY